MFNQIKLITGKRQPKNITELPNVANGQAHNVGAVTARCRAGGGKNDSDYLCIPPYTT